ncbi:MAG: DUF2662 domain-containing protein [Chloroflexi bacterium]|nr:MAG: DUF2662 domain-containing protein [Chloroflexota bacterium]
MLSMINRHIARLESQLERMVEGAFSNLLGKALRVQDIALQLAREMEVQAKPLVGQDASLVPGRYIIYINQEIYNKLGEQIPSIHHALVQYITDIATSYQYRFAHTPEVLVQGDTKLETGKIRIVAQETPSPKEHTAVMERVDAEEENIPSNNPQLLLDGEKPIPLRKSIVNIGRGRANDIVIDDPYVSRQHIQLRLRFGVYTLFDTNSRTGTWVNDVQVQEHALKSGDVIRIGQTRLIYLEDDEASSGFMGTTQSMDPIG